MPDFLNEIFPDSKNPVNLRQKSLFQTFNVKSAYKETESVF